MKGRSDPFSLKNNYALYTVHDTAVMGRYKGHYLDNVGHITTESWQKALLLSMHAYSLFYF